MQTRLASFIALVTLLGSLAASGAPHLSANLPDTLTYVESSGGLVPPELESGRTELEMGDVNGDGYLDLVSIGDHGNPYVNTDEHGIMVWFGDGAGTWSSHMVGNFGYGGIALGDANNDGLMDVAYGMHHNYSGVDLGNQLLEVALGDGTGMSWTPWDDGLATNGEDWGMFSTDFADLDNDGDLDVGSLSFGCCNGVHIYLNDGDGSWTQSFASAGGNSEMLFEFGDINGDGNADFVASDESGTVYLGDGTGNYSLEDGNLPPIPAYDTRPGVSLGDVTGDGGDDLGYINPSGGPEVWTWTGPSTWQEISGNLPASGGYEYTQLADLNTDGTVDLIAAGHGQIKAWAWDGGNTWTEIASFTTPVIGYFEAFRVGGDADHNGYPDIALVVEQVSGWTDQNFLRFFKEDSTPSSLEIKPAFPLGGETFRTGGTRFLDWVSAIPTGGPGTVSLELSTTGPGGPWQEVAQNLVNSGRYQWLIPEATPITDNAYLRYTLAVDGNTVQAISPGPFNILGGPEEPIDGLEAANSSPTALGDVTVLTATVSAGSNVSYIWDLGDGTFASGDGVEHLYPAEGEYTAIVTATNPLGSAQAQTLVIVQEAIAGLLAENDSPTPFGQATTLTATVTSGAGVSYTWDLGDGATIAGATISHPYLAPGWFTATVTAENLVSVAEVETLVLVEEEIGGLWATSSSPTALGLPTILTATFTAGTNVELIWEFGDGMVASGQVASHTYLTEGVFTATVTATNAVSSQVASVPVLVEESIAGLQAASDSPNVLGEATTLSATIVSGSNPVFTWDFGDGTSASGAQAVHTYAATGLYTATVTAANAVSSQQSTTTVQVEEAIAGLVVQSNSPVFLGEVTILSATVESGTQVIYTWDLGEGITLKGATVSYTYPAAGVFTVTLTAGNILGEQTTSLLVEVKSIPAWQAYLPAILIPDTRGETKQHAFKP